MKILIDSREQTPYNFRNYPDIEWSRGTLQTGDYALVGLEELYACERKSLQDLIQSISHDRTRFEKELARAKAFEGFWGICECSLQDIANGRYRSEMSQHAALQSIASFTVRYGTPFLFCGDRKGGEQMVHALLSKVLFNLEKRYQRIQKAQAE